MIVSTIALGAVSYLVLGVGARVVDPDGMASFLSLWALLNTMVLSAVIPIEHIAPRLIATMGLTLARRSIFAHALVLASMSTLLAVGASLLISSGGSASMYVAGAAFGVSFGVWSGRRAGLVGSGQFRPVMLRSIVNMLVASAGLGALLLFSHVDPALLFVPVVLGNLLGAANKAARAPQTTNSSVAPPMRLATSEYRLLGAMVGATFATVALNNGSLVLGRAWGVSADDLVAYAGLLNLVGVPYMLLNNVMAPLNLRLVHLARTHATAELTSVALKATAALVGTVAVCALGTALVGTFALRLLIGDGYDATVAFAVGVAIAEGAVWLTVIPRLLGSALGVTRPLVVSWGVGLAVFGFVGLLPIDGMQKVIYAPLSAAIVIVAIALPWMLRLARQPTVEPRAA